MRNFLLYYLRYWDFIQIKMLIYCNRIEGSFD